MFVSNGHPLFVVETARRLQQRLAGVRTILGETWLHPAFQQRRQPTSDMNLQYFGLSTRRVQRRDRNQILMKFYELQRAQL